MNMNYPVLRYEKGELIAIMQPHLIIIRNPSLRDPTALTFIYQMVQSGRSFRIHCAPDMSSTAQLPWRDSESMRLRSDTASSQI